MSFKSCVNNFVIISLINYTTNNKNGEIAKKIRKEITKERKETLPAPLLSVKRYFYINSNKPKPLNLHKLARTQL